MPSITKETIRGKDIVVVEISPGSNCPYYFKSKGIDDGTYVKIGASTRLADKLAILELRLRGQSQSYDEQIYMDAEINGLLREESYELPIRAIREAIINATIHRNFLLTSYVQVALYDDRLEVSSPGALFGSLTIEKALAGSTAVRNPIIAEVFKQMELFESWGTGLRRIQQSCKELGLSEPEFLEIGDMFRVNIFRSPVPIGEPIGEPKDEPFGKVAELVAELVAESVAEKPTIGEIGFLKAIESLLLLDDWFTNAKARKASGLAEGSVKRYMRNLTTKKILLAEGATRDRRYKLNKQ